MHLSHLFDWSITSSSYWFQHCVVFYSLTLYKGHASESLNTVSSPMSTKSHGHSPQKMLSRSVCSITESTCVRRRCYMFLDSCLRCWGIHSEAGGAVDPWSRTSHIRWLFGDWDPPSHVQQSVWSVATSQYGWHSSFGHQTLSFIAHFDWIAPALLCVICEARNSIHRLGHSVSSLDSMNSNMTASFTQALPHCGANHLIGCGIRVLFFELFVPSVTSSSAIQ
jgi:hypothetical protein